jgi:hypothetical protein
MRKVLRGYAKDKDGNLILIGTMPVRHSKDKSSPRERKDKRHLVRQGATIFKKETVGSFSPDGPPVALQLRKRRCSAARPGRK